MCDGPAYDYAYERAAVARMEKRERQYRRTEMLRNILTTEGFGEDDGDNSPLEKMAANSIRVAYDLLMLLSRAR